MTNDNKIIIFPTDTVYGIGTSVYNKKDILRIYEIKHRSLDKPLAVLCSSLEQIESIAYLDELDKIVINKFMPGALTIIVKAKDSIKESMNLEMVGVRIPNSRMALDILNQYGPLATTSVNDSGKSPLNDYEEIKDKYNGVVSKIYPPTDDVSSNIASTVVMIKDHKVTLIRQGQIDFNDIKKIYE